MFKIGEKLKKLRQQKNLTEKELAQILGVSVAAISAYENDLRKPSCENLVKLSHLYGVSIDYLLCEDCKMLNVAGLTEKQFLIIKELVQCFLIRNEE